jgi:hypothetical protein
MLGIALFERKEYDRIPPVFLRFDLLASLLTTGALLITAFRVLRAWAVREWRGPEERDIFNAEALSSPDFYQRYIGLHFTTGYGGGGP